MPFGAGACDLLENLCIVTLLAVYPAHPAAVAWLRTIGTVGKMSCLGVSTLLVLSGLVMAAARALSRKLTNDEGRMTRSRAMPPIIEIRNLRKTCGSAVAADDISFQVQPGEIFGRLRTAIRCRRIARL